MADDPRRQRHRRRRAAQTSALLGDGGRLLATSTAVVAGITYNFLPFMALPLYVSLEQIDPRLIEAAEDLYAVEGEGVPARDAAAVAAGRLRRHAAHVHPGRGRLHQRRAARARRASTMIGNVIQSKFLELTDYPAAAALSFVLMAAILVLDRDLRPRRSGRSG